MQKEVKKRKTSQATLLINPKQTTILGIDDFISRLFYKTINNQEYAVKFINGIIKGKDIEALKTELSIPESSFYSILRRFKALGLIKKQQGMYQTSDIFSKHLEHLCEFYRDYVKAYKPKAEVFKEEPITDEEQPD